MRNYITENDEIINAKTVDDAILVYKENLRLRGFSFQDINSVAFYTYTKTTTDGTPVDYIFRMLRTGKILK